MRHELFLFSDNCLLDFSVCGRESLIRQIGSIIYPAMRNIHLKLEEAIDLVKVHNYDMFNSYSVIIIILDVIVESNVCPNN